MPEIGQESIKGFSASERFMLIRSSAIGLIAPMATLWLGNVFDTNGPSLFSLTVILAALFSLLTTVVISIMRESFIEDIIKLVMFIAIWWFARQYDAFSLITLGLMVGSAVGFLNNRIEFNHRQKH